MKQGETKFNPLKHYLGSLCLRGHDYKNTGKSIRYKNGSHTCVACQQARPKKFSAASAQMHKNGRGIIKIECICPRCEQIHKLKIEGGWTGNGKPRKYCEKCDKLRAFKVRTELNYGYTT